MSHGPPVAAARAPSDPLHNALRQRSFSARPTACALLGMVGMSRVLLCQCAELMAHELKEALADEGITVTSCPSGESMIEALLREKPAAVVHVLSSDPQQDMALLRLLRRVAPEVPLILLAETGSLEVQRQLIELRPIFYDVLPVRPDDLLDAVRAAVERGAAAPKPRASARAAELRPPRH
jgi:DNA-binding NtrC family response regulator